MNSSAVECRVLWNQLPEFAKDYSPGQEVKDPGPARNPSLKAPTPTPPPTIASRLQAACRPPAGQIWFSQDKLRRAIANERVDKTTGARLELLFVHVVRPPARPRLPFCPVSHTPHGGDPHKRPRY